MFFSDKEVAQLASWPRRVRIEALKRIVPRAKVEESLAQSPTGQSFCRRLPAWFMVWFVIALGLFCRDSYRQVFRWLEPYRKDGTPGRSTLCEARKRLGVGVLRRLYEALVTLLGKPTTPGAFYQGLRLCPSTDSCSTWPTRSQTSGPSDAPAAAGPRARFLRYEFCRCVKRAVTCCGGA